MQPPSQFTYNGQQSTFIRNHTNGTQFWYKVFNVKFQRDEELPFTIGNINWIIKNERQN